MHPWDILEDSLGYLREFRVIGIVTTIQHVHQLDEISSFYERNGKSVMTGKPYGFAKKPGQYTRLRHRQRSHDRQAGRCIRIFRRRVVPPARRAACHNKALPCRGAVCKKGRIHRPAQGKICKAKQGQGACIA